MKKWLLSAVLAIAVLAAGVTGVSYTQSADPLPPEHSRG